MVTRTVCVLCILLMVPMTGAALDIVADETRIEYGKPVWLTIESAQRELPLQRLDLGPWQEEVVVLSEREVQTDSTGMQRWRVRLYPRRQGRLVLPGLFHAGERSAQLSLDVVPPVDPKLGTPMGVDCRYSTATPYQEQQVLTVCDIAMQDENVVFEYPRQSLAGAQLMPMQVTRDTHGTHIIHHPGWVVIPQRSGETDYDLPPLQLVRDGVITHRFYLPKLRLKVQALPRYLPGTIPVAQVRVMRYTLDNWLLAPARLANVRLQINVRGAPLDSLPDYAQRLRSDAVLQTYAATTQHTQRITAQGIEHTLVYTIPVTPRRQGLYRLPALRLQYFDAQSGTLQSVEAAGPRVLILAWWARLLIALAAFMLLFVVGRYLLRRLRRAWWRWRNYRDALAQLQGSADIVTLRRAMHYMARAEGWPTNLTYRQWCEKMSRARSNEFMQRPLYETSYAGIAHDLQGVHAHLRQLCRRRRFCLFAGTAGG